VGVCGECGECLDVSMWVCVCVCVHVCVCVYVFVCDDVVSTSSLVHVPISVIWVSYFMTMYVSVCACMCAQRECVCFFSPVAKQSVFTLMEETEG